MVHYLLSTYNYRVSKSIYIGLHLYTNLCWFQMNLTFISSKINTLKKVKNCYRFEKSASILHHNNEGPLQMLWCWFLYFAQSHKILYFKTKKCIYSDQSRCAWSGCGWILPTPSSIKLFGGLKANIAVTYTAF